MLRRPATLRIAATPARSQSVAITVALDLKRHLSKRQTVELLEIIWSEWQDLNLRPPRPEQVRLSKCSAFTGHPDNVRSPLFGLVSLFLSGNCRGERKALTAFF